MRAKSSSQTWEEKVAHGWWGGCNSVKYPWLLQETQYRWSVNLVNRGGVIQTRPGYRLRLSLPAGNLQGMVYFSPNKEGSITDDCLVFAVDGKVYYAPFPLEQPISWESFRLKNIQFNPEAKQIWFAQGEKTVQTSSSGEITFIPTYSVLMMQDGTTRAAFWDGVTNGHVDQTAPAYQTPTGTTMVWSGNRLWVATKTVVMAGDLGDPLSFKDRSSGELGSGDFSFDSDVTAFSETSSSGQLSDLLVFTINTTYKLKSSVADRELWGTTPGFQSIVLPSIGCVSQRSVTDHGGVVWFYSYGGLVAYDPSKAEYVTRETNYRDTEMGFCKRDMASDMSMIAGASFENYLLMSVPSGDTLNSKTMALDFSIAAELGSKEAPSWNGVWTGTRPVEWATAIIDGAQRIFHASIDYQSLSDGSFNHIWEAFMPDRTDSYTIYDASNSARLIQNPIYWSLDTKFFGDGMDYKKLRFAEIDLCEIGGEVNIKVSYCGSKGGYHEILSKKIVANLDALSLENQTAQEVYARTGDWLPQTRRVRTRDALIPQDFRPDVESKAPPNVDKYFGLRIEGCGRCGIDGMRLFMEPWAESSSGTCEEDESGINILTKDCVSIHLQS